MNIRICACVALLLAAGCAIAPPEEKSMVVNPRVTSDRSVDCSTLDRIVADLTNDTMNDEQKVLAVFNYVRRLTYHGDGCRELAYNVMFTLNVGGNGSCGRQTVIVAALLNKLGYKSQNWTRNGHHLMQVWYGDKWHCLDPHMTFYVYDRGNPPSIASIEQLQEDPTLALDAVKEKRACPGYLQCGDSPKVFAGKGGWKYYGDYPEGWGKHQIEEPFGDITLRRGETYVRTWMPGKHWFKANCWMKDSGPFHSCGGRRDKLDTVNWPIYEPHGAVTRYLTYRHWGAGYIEYAPSIDNGHYVDGVASESNIRRVELARKMVLTPADEGQPGEIVFAVNCPYVVTAGEVTTKLLADDVAMAVSIDGGKTWRPVASPAEGTLRKATFVDEVNGSRNGYLLRLTLDKGALFDVRIVTEFQLNPYSLPNLAPGKNTVRVTAARYDTPLTVRYGWSEGDGWKQERSAKKTLHGDGEFEIDVAGPKYPRMKALTLSVPQ